MKRNNLLLVLAAACCAVAVSGCDAIRALPNNYKDPIILNNDESKTDVYNNLMSQLYDQIAEGKNDKVHEEVINIIANDQLGSYDELKALVEANDDAKFAAFVNSHKEVYVHKNDESISTTTGKTKEEIQKLRVINTYNRIKERVNKVFYDEIKSGAYTDRSKFYEVKLAMAHFADLYDIKDLVENGKLKDSTVWYEKYIDNKVLTEDDVSQYIHLDRYEDYINRKIVPEILRDLLVEQYLFDYDQDTSHILGRAYGRKVNVIKIADESKYPNAAANLVDSFASTYITEQANPNADVDFELIADVWRGFEKVNEDGTVVPLSSEELSLASKAKLTVVTETELKAKYPHTAEPDFYTNMEAILGADFSYIKESKLGILLDKYVLIDENNRFATEDAKSALTEFTSSLTYSKEVGFAMKIAELGDNDYTTDGWYVKNGGLTDLPDSIRNRLFNINVATQVDHIAKEDMETVASNMGKYESTDYVRYINNHYYLTPETAEKFEDNPHNFVIYEGGASYIVEVVEAVTTSKLDLENANNSYNKLRENDIVANPLFTEEIAMEIAHVLGSKDTYVNDAYAHYIELYDINHHSTAVYNYFKEKYPDLFED